MKNRIYLPILVVFVSALALIIGCSMTQAPEEVESCLAFSIEFMEDEVGEIESAGKSQIDRSIATLERVHCRILHQQSIVWDDDLTLSGGVFKASIVVEAGAGYSAEIDCYETGLWVYSGLKTGIEAVAGETSHYSVLLYTTHPSDLTAETVSNSEIDLNWTDKTYSELGFKIERKQGEGGSFSVIDSVDADVVSYQDIGLDEDIEYYYRVQAYNSDAPTDYSNIASATTNLLIPAAPTNLQATAVTTSQIDLTWEDNASNEDGFSIERKSDTEPDFSVIADVAADIESYQDTSGLLENTVYFYRVRAYNTEGNSTYSNVASATTEITTPLPPSGLEAAAVSASQIDLEWTDNSDNELGFKIERKEGIGGTFEEVAEVEFGVTQYSDQDLNQNTEYFYRVASYNIAGVSSYSNIASATTETAQLSAPSDLEAEAVSDSQIDLQWTDNSGNEDGFKIERKTGAGGTYAEIDDVSADETDYQDTGLDENTEYFYRVYAYNSAGDSDYSNEANATTQQSVPAAPTGLQATAVSYSQIDLQWTDNSNNEDGFKIERKTGAGGTYAEIDDVSADETDYQDTGLDDNTEYFYRVYAYNSGGDSDYSNEANATTQQSVPAAPTGLQATAVSYSQIDLQWTDNSNNEDGFKIERKTGAGGTYAEIDDVSADETDYQDTGLDDNTEYFYRVYAYNSGGDSDYSNEANATTPSTDIIYVPGDYPTIQAGINAASNGYTVMVADGIYSGTGNINIDFSGKAITVLSENGNTNCTIDCENSGRGFNFHSGENSNSVLDGFKIINGSTTVNGGGILLDYSSPSIQNCIFNNCTAEMGGGVECDGTSAPIFDNCNINGNSALSYGAGIHIGGTANPSFIDCVINSNISAIDGGGLNIYGTGAGVTFTGCTINSNQAQIGGGIFVAGNADATLTNCSLNHNMVSDVGGGANLCDNGTITVTNCDFTYNTATVGGAGIYVDYNGSPTITGGLIDNNIAQDVGGGIYIRNTNAVTVDNVTISNNSATNLGGGIGTYTSTVTISKCDIFGNSSGSQGGAIWCHSTSGSISYCSIYDNESSWSGGGIEVCSGTVVSITNCTISGNSHGGIKIINSSPTIINTILEGNTVNAGIVFDNSSSTSVTYSDFHNNQSGDFSGGVPANLGNITTTNANGDPSDQFFNIFLNPLFVNPWGGDFSLQSGSACIDAGDPASPLDPDGTVADIGAFYFPQ